MIHSKLQVEESSDGRRLLDDVFLGTLVCVEMSIGQESTYCGEGPVGECADFVAFQHQSMDRDLLGKFHVLRFESHKVCL